MTDRFTYGDLARFTVWILRTCTDGALMSGKGGRVEMVDRAGGWGGFWLRVDGWNPYPSNMARNNGSVLTTEAASSR